MGDHDTKPVRKPAAAAAPRPRAPAPKPKVVSAPAMPAGPATYEADRLVTGLLHKALETGERALSVYTLDRGGQVMMAAEKITAYVHELVEVAAGPDIAWDAHAVDLASLANLVGQLTSELSTAGLALSVNLSTAYAQLAFHIPAASLAAQPGRAAVVPLDEAAHLDLARHAMGAARVHLEQIPVLEPKTAPAQAKAFSAPLKLHFAIASDEAHAVTDRRARRTLKPDVEAVSVAMDQLAESLAMKPQIPWDVSFASAFDAENELRAELGLVARARPYSGNVDPVAAVQQVRSIANGELMDTRGETWTDPGTAVQAIITAVEQLFDQQLLAITKLGMDLQHLDPVPPRSWTDLLVEIGTNVAISAVAGAMGALASRFFAKRLEEFQLGLSVPRSVLDELSNEERGIIASQLLPRSGVLARAVVGESLKDGTKEMFKSAVRQATAKHYSPPGTSALEDFVYTHVAKLQFAKQQAGLAVLHLSPALRQADMQTLNVLAYTLTTTMPDAARDSQYDHSMREWQNFKARLSAGPASVQMGRSTDRDADVGDEHTPGVVEIGLAVTADRTVTRRSLRLRDAEPAARAHFRRLAIPLGTIALNQRYDVLLLAQGNSDTIAFGVAPDRGLIIESLTSRERRLLKMLAEHEPATLWNVNRALRGEFDATDDAAAYNVARGLIQQASTYNTASLED